MGRRASVEDIDADARQFEDRMAVPDRGGACTGEMLHYCVWDTSHRLQRVQTEGGREYSWGRVQQPQIRACCWNEVTLRNFLNKKEMGSRQEQRWGILPCQISPGKSVTSQRTLF